MNTNKKLNMTMLCDFYELTMGNGYFQATGIRTASPTLICSSAACRTAAASPSRRGWSRSIEYIQNLHFDRGGYRVSAQPEHVLTRSFWTIWPTFKFTGDIWAVPEGTPVFPERADPHRPRPRHPGAAAWRPICC